MPGMGDNCSELVVTNSNLHDPDSQDYSKLSIWQINFLPRTATTHPKYHFTKVKDLYEDSEEGQFIGQAVSPCGSQVATMSTSE